MTEHIYGCETCGHILSEPEKHEEENPEHEIVRLEA